MISLAKELERGKVLNILGGKSSFSGKTTLTIDSSFSSPTKLSNILSTSNIISPSPPKIASPQPLPLRQNSIPSSLKTSSPLIVYDQSTNFIDQRLEDKEERKVEEIT
jgi:hypothetical protein